MAISRALPRKRDKGIPRASRKACVGQLLGGKHDTQGYKDKRARWAHHG